MRRLPERPRPGGSGDAGASHLRLEAVRQRRDVEVAGCAQPGQEVGGRAVGQRRADEPHHRATESRVARGQAAVDGDRDARRGEDPLDERGRLARRAHDHGDLLRRDPAGEQRRDVLGHELELGALTAALQQGDGVARLDRGAARAGVRGEELTLEVVQRRPGGRRVVLGARRQLLVGGGQALEDVDGLPRAAERRPSRLVGERHQDVRAGVDGQRLHRVELERREVVEPVEDDGRAAPAPGVEAQRVERRARVEDRVGAPEAGQRVAVGAVERPEVLRVGGPGEVLCRPGPDRAPPPPRVHPALLELVDEAQERPREAGGRRRGAEHAQVGPRDGHGGDALARELAQRAAVETDATGDRLQEPVEGHHGRPEDEAVRGELAAVGLHVGGPRDDEQAAGAGAGALGVEGTARLGGVGGAGDEVQGHAGRNRVAHRAGGPDVPPLVAPFRPPAPG